MLLLLKLTLIASLSCSVMLGAKPKTEQTQGAPANGPPPPNDQPSAPEKNGPPPNPKGKENPPKSGEKVKAPQNTHQTKGDAECSESAQKMATEINAKYEGVDKKKMGAVHFRLFDLNGEEDLANYTEVQFYAKYREMADQIKGSEKACNDEKVKQELAKAARYLRVAYNFLVRRFLIKLINKETDNVKRLGYLDLEQAFADKDFDQKYEKRMQKISKLTTNGKWAKTADAAVGSLAKSYQVVSELRKKWHRQTEDWTD